jgi:16S rRNA processing protein RimM
MDRSKRICLGAVVAPHGVRGAVRVKTFTAEPSSVAAYGPLEDEARTRTFRLHVLRAGPDHVIARMAGVTTRNAAEEFVGTQLFVARAALPAPAADEFYIEDLIGLVAEDRAGKLLGKVIAADDFGAGAVVEIALEGGGAAMVPFTQTYVPAVDVARGCATVVLPEGTIERPAQKAPKKAREDREGAR